MNNDKIENKYIYVVDINEKPLLPITQEGFDDIKKDPEIKYRVFKRYPYTIQILDDIKGHKRGPVICNFHTSNDIMAISVSSEGNEIYNEEITHRKNVSKLIKIRATHRRGRRYRNESREPRKKHKIENKNEEFKPKNREFNPVTAQKIEAHINAFNRVKRILPIDVVYMDDMIFDPRLLKEQKIDDERIKDNNKAYVLARDNHICQMCYGKTKIKSLEVAKVTRPKNFRIDLNPWYTTPANMITLCSKCYEAFIQIQNNYYRTVWEDGEPEKHSFLDLSKRFSDHITHCIENKETLKLGRMKREVFDKLSEANPDIEFNHAYGYQTKRYMDDNKIPYSPLNMATSMTPGQITSTTGVYCTTLIREHDRSLHKGKPKKGTGERDEKIKFSHGFQAYDKVLYNGEEYYIVNIAKTGYFRLGKADGTVLVGCAKWDKLTLVSHKNTHPSDYYIRSEYDKININREKCKKGEK